MKKILWLVLFALTFAFAGDLVLEPTAQELAKAKPATNTICPITHQKVGEMGTPISVIYKGQVVLLCCNGCKSTFAENPEKYMSAAASTAPANSEKPCKMDGKCSCMKDGKCSKDGMACKKDGAKGCTGQDGKPCKMHAK